MVRIHSLNAIILAVTLFVVFSCAEKQHESQEVGVPQPPSDLHGMTNAAQQESIEGLARELATRDFSEYIATGASFVEPFTAEQSAGSNEPNVWLDTVNSGKRAQVKKEGLSAREVKRLSAWSYYQKPRDFTILSNYVGMFANEEGRLPVDGQELLQHSLAGEDAASFKTLIEADQVSYVSTYIDPLTGKLWGPLDSVEWSPLGVSFRRVPDEETIADFGGVDVIGTEQNGCTLAFQLELTLWGEEPDEILFRGKSAMFFPPNLYGALVWRLRLASTIAACSPIRRRAAPP